jgi:hypothetical protein
MKRELLRQPPVFDAVNQMRRVSVLESLLKKDGQNPPTATRKAIAK